MDAILQLTKEIPEIYQDIELDGKVVVKGIRDCKKRWDIIKDHIKPHDVVMDIGSSLGYFAHKIAKEYPDSLVISFESDPKMCEIQRGIFEHEGIYNVVVCNYRLGREDLERWVKHVELFDVVLALSVFHHIPKDEVYGFYNGLSKMSDRIIFELSAIDEKEACGQDTFQELERIRNIEGEWLGDDQSHLGCKREVILHKGKFAGTNLDAFYGVSHPDRHRFEIKDGKINGKHIIKGVNVWNLLHYNIVWPERSWWRIQADAAYYSLKRKSDVRPWNLLVTSTGLTAIDYTTKFPKGDQAAYKKDDLRKLDRLVNEMKPLDWRSL